MKAFLAATLFATGSLCPCANAQQDDSFRKCQALAEKGDAVAQAALGVCYDDGLGVERNPAEAVKWYRKAAEQGRIDSQYLLGSCYERGHGVEQNLTEAVKWYRKAAEQGQADAQYFLGYYYEIGVGVGQNSAEAARWYRKAGEQGNRTAQSSLGSFYARGEGVEKNQAEAAQWFRRAAEQGYANAQCNLGYCYERGEGVEKNRTEAVKWYRKAAEQGCAIAQCNLGYCYENGEGVEKNQLQAVEWFRMAAEQGYSDALWSLGDCYEKGPVKNFIQAYGWWSLAAADERLKGSAPYASERMSLLTGLISHEQIAVAEQLATAFAKSQNWPPVSMQALAAAFELGRKKPPENANAPAPFRGVPRAAPSVTVAAEIAPNSIGVDMIREDGVLKVPVQLNGAISLKFVIDSGASDVQIPKDVFLTLIRAETIQEKDFLAGKSFRLADGSTVKSDRFILRSIKVGESRFSDVEASIGGLNAELLLGQSFLSRFTEVKIDNKNGKLILSK